MVKMPFQDRALLCGPIFRKNRMPDRIDRPFRIFALLAVAAASGCVDRRPADEWRAAAEEANMFAAEAARQVRRCYRAPRVPSVGRAIVTELRVRYGPDGSVIGLPLVVAQRGVTPANQVYAGSMAEAARLAVMRCSPISVPPRFADLPYSEFDLVFSPRRRV